eukprot:TRINITY_DN2217_c0_g1_i2.p1 TRINITY_DN2217_c0_g1~~TRINITY_DN2217_c0_g1_i2.p1  ORF type:complete len:820 (-),score=148.91 TRINITY_DN2217_c0_g1_i2:481-2940(-)
MENKKRKIHSGSKSTPSFSSRPRDSLGLHSTLKLTDDESNSDDDDEKDTNENTSISTTTTTIGGKEEETIDWAELSRQVDGESDSESSHDEEEMKNRIGDVPLKWYDKYDHIGYDIGGHKIIRQQNSASKLDMFLARKDDPNFRRTIYDALNDQYVVLSDHELSMIHRIRHGKFPHSNFDPYPDYVDWFTSVKQIESLKNPQQPKSKFIPSKWEARAVVRLEHAIRNGWIKDTDKQSEKKETEVAHSEPYLLWSETSDDQKNKRTLALPPPKMKLPGHSESYNPPPEYLLSEEEKDALNDMDPEDRPSSSVPQQFASLREVPYYGDFIKERFERCLDLYLCPRRRINRVKIADPKTLIPQLPKPRDLRPFPSTLSIEYVGHTGKVRSISVSPCGQWIASGSDDGTVRLWEVSTGRCFYVWDFVAMNRAENLINNRQKKTIEKRQQSSGLQEEKENDERKESTSKDDQTQEDEDERNLRTISVIDAVCWNPNPLLPLLAIASNEKLYLLPTGTGCKSENEKVQQLLASVSMKNKPTAESNGIREEEETKETRKKKPTSESITWSITSTVKRQTLAVFSHSSSTTNIHAPEAHVSSVCIRIGRRVRYLTWHAQGDYFASIATESTSQSSLLIHRLSQAKSQFPFSKNKGILQCVRFHPSKPLLFVASQRHVRVYNLAQQSMVKKLLCPARWISSLDIHPTGDHVLLGSFDRRVCWYDMDMQSTPYKTLKYHRQAVRQVSYHHSYPLFASASDDGSLHIFHGMVYNDLMTNPLLVPVKILKAHRFVPIGSLGSGLGVLDCVFHPHQPWIFSCGADQVIRLWC